MILTRLLERLLERAYTRPVTLSRLDLIITPALG
jgi:hypothetical protein